MSADSHELWTQVLGELQKHMSKPSFDSWLAPSRAERDESCLHVLLPDEFSRDWLETRYSDTIESIASGLTGTKMEVVFEVVPSAMPSLEAEEGEYLRDLPEEPTPSIEIPQKVQRPSYDPGEFTSLPLNPAYTFTSFVVGPSNQFARATAESVARSPGDSYNPLFIYGGVGLGKTHLLHAIGHLARKEHEGLTVRYVSGETFLYRFVSAIREGKTAEFREAYREVDLWLVDDIQLIAERKASRTEQEFFNTFNELYGVNKQIVITSDCPPKDLTFSHDRMTSRFEWGLICDIAAPDFETRVAILQRKADDYGALLSDEVFEYIAEMIPANVRILEGALKKLIAYCRHFNTAPSLKVAKTIVAPYSTDKGQSEVTVDRIKSVVADHFAVSVEDLIGSSRTKAISLPRQVAMFLGREMTNLSLPAIGNSFGGRDHTTVMYAVQKIESALGQNSRLSSVLEELRQKVRQP